MGERIRLKKDFDTSKFTPEVKVILEGLKKYGMLVADNGIDWAVSVAPDERIPLLHAELRQGQGLANSRWSCRRRSSAGNRESGEKEGRGHLPRRRSEAKPLARTAYTGPRLQ